MTSKRKLRRRIAELEQALVREGVRRGLGEFGPAFERLRESPTITKPWSPEVGTGHFVVRCTCPPNRGDNFAGSCPIHDVQVFS